MTGRFERLRDEDGSAALEFVSVGLLMLLPLVYLILTLSQLQSAALATEGTARQAARTFVQAADLADGEQRIDRAVQFGLADFGIDVDHADVVMTCTPDPSDCLARSTTVTVTVRVSVPMGVAPGVLDLSLPISLPVEATAVQRVSVFRADR